MKKLTTKRVIAYLTRKMKKASVLDAQYIKNCILTLEDMKKYE